MSTRAPLFSSANNIILNNFYLHLINMCYKQTKYFFYFNYLFRAILPALGPSSWSTLWAHVGPKTELTIPKCLDRGSEHSCPVHKPQGSSRARLGKRAYKHLAADTTFSPAGRWGAVTEALLDETSHHTKSEASTWHVHQRPGSVAASFPSLNTIKPFLLSYSSRNLHT